MSKGSSSAWERAWAPYDDATYAFVLEQLQPADRILDIGAGDLRLSRQMALLVAQVIALEIDDSLPGPPPYPQNLRLISADARQYPFSAGVTTAVLLMRHCRHFGLYRRKLVDVGCRRLITNARWGFGVEVIDLQAPLQPFSSVSLGWYACRCGAAGFVSGSADELTPALETQVHQVAECSSCAGLWSNASLTPKTAAFT